MGQAWLLAGECGMLVLAEEESAPQALAGSLNQQNTLQEKRRCLTKRNNN